MENRLSILLKLQCWQNASDEHTKLFEAQTDRLDEDTIYWANYYAGNWTQLILYVSAENLFDLPDTQLNEICQLLVMLRDTRQSRRLSRHWFNIGVQKPSLLTDSLIIPCFELTHDFGSGDFAYRYSSIAELVSKTGEYPPSTVVNRGQPVLLKGIHVSVRRKENLANIEEMFKLLSKIKSELNELRNDRD